jgi:hypothetical protein
MRDLLSWNSNAELQLPSTGTALWRWIDGEPQLSMCLYLADWPMPDVVVVGWESTLT